MERNQDAGERDEIKNVANKLGSFQLASAKLMPLQEQGEIPVFRDLNVHNFQGTETCSAIIWMHFYFCCNAFFYMCLLPLSS